MPPPRAPAPVIRIGVGYDSHRFGEGRQLILGGQHIPHAMGLEGHSDADVAAHALADAVLGAARAGDIGRLFPDTDARWKNANSLGLLQEVAERVRELGFHPRQADLTIIAEGPKLGPYVEAMERALARTLGIPPDRLSVKAKTNEGMGWIGRGEGIAVIAVATVEER
jgi:2-C-methyl-D-erythritol 2,4-cyclodiphosphate synthase